MGDHERGHEMSEDKKLEGCEVASIKYDTALDPKWVKVCEICKESVDPRENVRLFTGVLAFADYPPIEALDTLLSVSPKHIRCSPSRGQYVYPASKVENGTVQLESYPMCADDRPESSKSVLADQAREWREKHWTAIWLLLVQWCETTLAIGGDHSDHTIH